MPSKTTEEPIALLQPNEVFCERVNNYQDYLGSSARQGVGLVDWIERTVSMHAGRQHPRPPPASTHPPQQRAPCTSASTAPDILSELGYGTAEIDAIFSRGGVRTGGDGESGGVGSSFPPVAEGGKRRYRPTPPGSRARRGSRSSTKIV